LVRIPSIPKKGLKIFTTRLQENNNVGEMELQVSSKECFKNILPPTGKKVHNKKLCLQLIKSGKWQLPNGIYQMAFFFKIDIYGLKIGKLDIYGCLKSKYSVSCHFDKSTN